MEFFVDLESTNTLELLLLLHQKLVGKCVDHTSLFKKTLCRFRQSVSHTHIINYNQTFLGVTLHDYDYP